VFWLVGPSTVTSGPHKQVIFAPLAQASSYATDYTCWLHSLNKLLFQFINILLYSEFPWYQQQKQSHWNERKRQRWSYL